MYGLIYADLSHFNCTGILWSFQGNCLLERSTLPEAGATTPRRQGLPNDVRKAKGRTTQSHRSENACHNEHYGLGMKVELVSGFVADALVN
jgi:hypothetical protein